MLKSINNKCTNLQIGHNSQAPDFPGSIHLKYNRLPSIQGKKASQTPSVNYNKQERHRDYSQKIQGSKRYQNMISDLQNIQKTLKTIIHSVNDIQNEIMNPLEAKRSNIRNSILLKIPKYLILSRVLPFLTSRECNYLSSTCSLMRHCIYSPLGWKFMTYSHSPYPVAVVATDVSGLVPLQRNESVTSSELEENIEDYQDEEYLLRERGKYKEVLWTRYKQYLSAKEKNEVLQQKVRSQKIFLFKRGLEKDYFQQQASKLQKQNAVYKQNLKKIHDDFTHKYDRLGRQISQIELENTKLQKQKEALVAKIKQYQNAMPSINRDAEKSKEILSILKDFVTKMEFQELEQIDFQI